MTKAGYTAVGDGVSVPLEAIMEGPSVQWNHIDGPLMCWAGELHWLTLTERLGIAFGLTSVWRIAEKRWPHLDLARWAIVKARIDAALKSAEAQ